MRKIPLEYFELLLTGNPTVPRYKSDGSYIDFVCGWVGFIGNNVDDRKVKAKCTQSGPPCLVLFEEPKLNQTQLETAAYLFERKYSASVIATLLGVTESNLLSQVKK